MKKFKMSEEQKKKISRAKTGVKFSEQHKINMGNAHNKTIIQLDSKGNFIKEWPSIKKASLTLNINRDSIGNFCRGTRLHNAGGYKWKFKVEKA